MWFAHRQNGLFGGGLTKSLGPHLFLKSMLKKLKTEGSKSDGAAPIPSITSQSKSIIRKMNCIHAQNEPIYLALMMKAENPLYTGWATKAAQVIRTVSNSLYHDESPLGDAALSLSAINFIQDFIDDTMTFLTDVPAGLGLRSVMAVFAK